jgi:hypothetical protein
MDVLHSVLSQHPDTDRRWGGAMGHKRQSLIADDPT